MTDEELTAIYNAANGITGKRLPITTERIFAAMRAAMEEEREECAAHVEQYGCIAGLQGACKVMANGIRMRSNAERKVSRRTTRTDF